MAAFVPDVRDVVWLTFDPQAGHEQSGRRPALVVSPASYNRKSGIALVCPVTSQIKAYPFEVALPSGVGVVGAVLVDQIKSLDWRARRVSKAGRVSESTMAEVVARLAPLIGY